MPQPGVYIKDPTETLDYTEDWGSGEYPGPWLVEGDAIAISTWTVPAGLTGARETSTDTTTTVWISGGTAGRKYTVTNTVTTTAGRIGTRSITIVCQPR